MYEFSSQANLFIQAFLVVIAIGVFYTIWSSTKIYGGIIGRAIRFLGLGMLFVIISALEHTLIVFQIVMQTPNIAIAQDLMTFVGLVLLGVGFAKLASAAKA